MTSLGHDASQHPADGRGAIARHIANAWQSVSGFIRRSAVRRDDLARLDRYGGCNVILRDMGVTESDVSAFVKGAPEAERLLGAMAAHLGITVADLAAPMRYELRIACVTCPSQRQCGRWLASSDKSADYRSFCPNAALFDAVLHPAQPK